MKKSRRLWINGILVFLLLLAAAFTTAVILGGEFREQLEPSDALHEYGPFRVGNSLENVETIIEEGELVVVGRFLLAGNQATWQIGDSVPMKLPAEELSNNDFLRSGWAYPVTPIERRMIQLIGVDDWGDMTYLYFDENDRVSTIYVGGS